MSRLGNQKLERSRVRRQMGHNVGFTCEVVRCPNAFGLRREASRVPKDFSSRIHEVKIAELPLNFNFSETLTCSAVMIVELGRSISLIRPARSIAYDRKPGGKSAVARVSTGAGALGNRGVVLPKRALVGT